MLAPKLIFSLELLIRLLPFRLWYCFPVKGRVVKRREGIGKGVLYICISFLFTLDFPVSGFPISGKLG